MLHQNSLSATFRQSSWKPYCLFVFQLFICPAIPFQKSLFPSIFFTSDFLPMPSFLFQYTSFSKMYHHWIWSLLLGSGLLLVVTTFQDLHSWGKTLLFAVLFIDVYWNITRVGPLTFCDGTYHELCTHTPKVQYSPSLIILQKSSLSFEQVTSFKRCCPAGIHEFLTGRMTCCTLLHMCT